MRRVLGIVTPCLCSFLASAIITAQTPLQVPATVSGTLGNGEVVYTTTQETGDYIAGTITSFGQPLALTVLAPDGSPLRAFVSGRSGETPFDFVADTPGRYRFQLRALDAKDNTQAPARYQLNIKAALSLNARFSREPVWSAFMSSDITALLKAGEDTTILERFWTNAKRVGTPLVERFDKDPRYVLVTFLWRDDDHTKNVLVTGTFTGQPRLQHTMKRVPGTDVWYLTLKLPAGARFSYQLSPNDPITLGIAYESERHATLQADPLNLRWRATTRTGKGRFENESLVELPGALPQPWIVRQEGIPTGTVTKQVVASRALAAERSVSVYVPAGYDYRSATQHELIVVFDEAAYVPLATLLDNLILARRIPPTIAVMVSHPPQSRSRELYANRAFADFVGHELIPWVRAHYRIASGPQHVTIAGSSAGGFAAVYVALHNTNMIRNVLCQSGSFWWAPDHRQTADSDASTETGWLAKQFLAAPKLPLRFYLEAGAFETDFYGGTGGGILEPTRHFRDVLLAKGYDVHYKQVAGGHDPISWQASFPDALLVLLQSAR